MLCQHQERSEQPCASGLSKRIKCLQGWDMDCMNQCHSSCPSFSPVERPASVRTSPVHAAHLPPAEVSGTGKRSCGGCGQVRVLPSENKFI